MLFQSENKRQSAAVCLMALLLSLFLNKLLWSPYIQYWGIVSGIMASNIAFRTATPGALREIPCTEIPVLALTARADSAAHAALKAGGTQTSFIGINGFKPPEWILTTWFEGFCWIRISAFCPKMLVKVYTMTGFSNLTFLFHSFGKNNLTMSSSTDRKVPIKQSQSLVQSNQMWNAITPLLGGAGRGHRMALWSRSWHDRECTRKKQDQTECQHWWKQTCITAQGNYPEAWANKPSPDKPAPDGSPPHPVGTLPGWGLPALASLFALSAHKHRPLSDLNCILLLMSAPPYRLRFN